MEIDTFIKQKEKKELKYKTQKTINPKNRRSIYHPKKTNSKRQSTQKVF